MYNTKYVEEHHLIDSYVLGHMSEHDEIQFEAFLLDHPDYLDQVAQARGFYASLHDNRDLLDAQVSTGLLDRSWFGNFLRVALFLLAVGAVYLGVRSMRIGSGERLVVRLENVRTIQAAEYQKVTIAEEEIIVFNQPIADKDSIFFKMTLLDSDRIELDSRNVEKSKDALVWEVPVSKFEGTHFFLLLEVKNTAGAYELYTEFGFQLKR